MGGYKVSLSLEEEKALLTDMISIQGWIDNAVQNKVRQCIDKIVEDNSDKQPSKLGYDEKLTIVKLANVETAAERQTEFEAEINEVT